MKCNAEWKDYEILATGDGEKLERWKNVLLLRPDPQVIWHASEDLAAAPGLNARYLRSERGGGEWQIFSPYPAEWTVSWRNLTFLIKPMGFKHTGLFPEQAVNWDAMGKLIEGERARREARGEREPVRVLNLFAYTGGATLACMAAGAHVTHVDAAKGMVERAGQNVDCSKLPRDRVRFIVDDCMKFVQREIRRGKRYDAVVMDPPSYGRGPGGEMWKIETGLFDLCLLCRQVLVERPLFYLINSYTTGLQPAVLGNLLELTMKGTPGATEAYEVCLPTAEGIVLPCGASGLWAGGRD